MISQDEILEGWESFLRPITPLLEKALQEVLKPSNTIIVPEPKNILNCFYTCPFERLKVVIPGLTPYKDLYYNSSGESVPVANGLSFATVTSNHVPAVLHRIIGTLNVNEYPQEFDGTLLERTEENAWGKRQAFQGCFMPNFSFSSTTRGGDEHAEYWQPFSEALFAALINHKPLVWLLMGEKITKAFEGKISKSNVGHKIVSTSYPISNTFVREYPFTKVNKALKELNQIPINW